VPAEPASHNQAQLVIAIAGAAALCAVSVFAVPSTTVALGTVARIVAVGVPLAVGLYAWRRPPFELFGKLLVATGLAGLLVTLSLSDDAVLYSTGRVALWIVEAGLLYIVLCFPSGRPGAGIDRALVVALVLVVALLFLPTALLVERYVTPATWVTCDSDCPRNAFMVVAEEPKLIKELVIPVRELLVIGLFAAVIGRLAQRIHGATTLVRVTLTPVLAVSIARIFVFGSAFAVRRMAPESPVVDVQVWLLALSVPAMAVAFLVGLLRSWVHVGASLRRLAARLRSRLRADELRDALADAFEDPSLEIVYPFGGDWLDSTGEDVQPPAPGSARCLTEVHDGERTVAAMIHDAALKEEQAFVDAATSYAILMLENQRLTVNTLVLLRALGDSRERVMESADAERRRIERDLHDGAQQRLVAVAIRLEFAADLVGEDPARGRALLRDLANEVEIALGEVRSLGRGTAPRLLARRGLADALTLAAEDAPIPTTVRGGPLPRYSPEIESAAYFCALEALQNVSKHATGATRVRITLAERDQRLRIEVYDDGAGFDPAAVSAGGGLTNMRERAADVGGNIRVDSGPGRGTRVVITIPLVADTSSESGEASPAAPP
jgi:signal transduction histidine kinase